jgi:hypothetical protein
MLAQAEVNSTSACLVSTDISPRGKSTLRSRLLIHVSQEFDVEVSIHGRTWGRGMTGVTKSGGYCPTCAMQSLDWPGLEMPFRVPQDA